MLINLFIRQRFIRIKESIAYNGSKKVGNKHEKIERRLLTFHKQLMIPMKL